MSRLSILAPLALSLAPLLAQPALAGPAEDLARARIASIAGGDLAAVTGAYLPSATLHWVGGPLDGTYAGPGAIAPVWAKFTTAQGPLTARIGPLTEAATPKGATVTADVTFAGRTSVRVLYVLVYRDGKVADEIWQVNPARPD